MWTAQDAILLTFSTPASTPRLPNTDGTHSSAFRGHHGPPPQHHQSEGPAPQGFLCQSRGQSHTEHALKGWGDCKQISLPRD